MNNNIVSAIINQLFTLLALISKTILNTLCAFKQKVYLDCILSLTKKKNEKLTQSNLESPWTVSGLPLELPVLCITQTVDLIKPLIN